MQTGSSNPGPSQIASQARPSEETALVAQKEDDRLLLDVQIRTCQLIAKVPSGFGDMDVAFSRMWNSDRLYRNPTVSCGCNGGYSCTPGE